MRKPPALANSPEITLSAPVFIGTVAGTIVALIRATAHVLHHLRCDVLMHGIWSSLRSLNSPNAPLTGAVHQFKLIDTRFRLAPVMVASVTSMLVIKALGLQGEIAVGPRHQMTGMRAVTFFDHLFKRSSLPVLPQPALGTCALSVLALITRSP